jgi:ATP-dependent Clp protease ATP-binding subunit ClpA
LDQNALENPLAEQTLRGNFVSGNTIKISIIDNQLEFLHAA